MGSKSSKDTLDDTLFNLRFAGKTLIKESDRSQKEEKIEKDKAKRALEKGLIDNARIAAENAIRKKNEALNYLRLSSKLDAVASKIMSASRTEAMTRQFSQVIPQMNRAMKSMNLENISETMGQFEKCFENLDVASGYVSESLNQTTTVSTPRDQVDNLLGMIASEHNIEVRGQLGEAPLGISAKEIEESNKIDVQKLK
ncbi:unnamed protein product [Blepharisma stoltei]|uniref:Uncharacterized protein n=1 Tax=Blepharisma stoltei TaxID=1481888 RepID=A0AAU9JRD9_9CILI|nr:unnamed protein product [Blepharisma stoltei]